MNNVTSLSVCSIINSFCFVTKMSYVLSSPAISIQSEVNSKDSDLGCSPGDGVCPTVQSLNGAYNSACEVWKTSANKISDDPLCRTAFLDLMEKIPPLHLPSMQDLDAVESTSLTAQCVLRLQTSTDPICTQREKNVPFMMILASSSWETFPVIDGQKIGTFQVEGSALRLEHITRLVLAWSYILSCRWVEVLGRSGENATMLHQGQDEDFWSLLRDERWRATLKRSRKTYYSPFMLRSDGAAVINSWVLCIAKWS